MNRIPWRYWERFYRCLPDPAAITNRSFRYAAPCQWNEFPSELRDPRQTQSPSLSPITHGSSSSSPSSLSLLSSSIARSVFHSELKTSLYHRPFPLLPD